MGFHPESGGICINENSGYHCFQGYPLVCLIPLYIIFKPRGSESPSEVWFPCYLLLHHSQTFLLIRLLTIPFEYHLLLHHSQTLVSSEKQCSEFEYHLLLHHSQTDIRQDIGGVLFEYHLLLHHSQTFKRFTTIFLKFEYHLLLHHSQTSNSKMKCHHLHKAWYSNTLINFTSVFIYNITNPPFQASPFLVFDK